MRFVANGSVQMQAPASAVADLLQKRGLVLISGPVGAGKTTLVKLVMHELGYTRQISSPTFTIANEYKVSEMTVYHLDLYRLSEQDIASGLLSDYLATDALTVVEWPERAPAGFWPREAVQVTLSATNDGKGRIVEVA